MQQGGVAGIEEVGSFDGPAVDHTRLGQPIEGSNPGREVIESGEMSE
jgi:hypothetical protein